MTIRAISLTKVQQQCDACLAGGVETIREIAATEAQLGLPDSVDCVVMPPCSVCGGVELAFRQPPGAPGADWDSEHNGAVNALHRLLVEGGTVSAAITGPARAKLQAKLQQERAQDPDLENPSKRRFTLSAELQPVVSADAEIFARRQHASVVAEIPRLVDRIARLEARGAGDELVSARNELALALRDQRELEAGFEVLERRSRSGWLKQERKG
jgi:hypothetical protein